MKNEITVEMHFLCSLQFIDQGVCPKCSLQCKYLLFKSEPKLIVCASASKTTLDAHVTDHQINFTDFFTSDLLSIQIEFKERFFKD